MAISSLWPRLKQIYVVIRYSLDTLKTNCVAITSLLPWFLFIFCDQKVGNSHTYMNLSINICELATINMNFSLL